VGYKQDETITIDWRAFQDPGVQLRALAQDLVAGKVDLIVALGTPAARAAMSATTSIPVVFLSGDPIASNLADSLSRPGRNASGVSILSPELTAKRLEYIHMVAPRARRIVYLMSTTNQLEIRQYEALSNAARDLGLKVAALNCARPEELDGVLSTLQRDPPDGLVVSGNALFLDGRRKVTAAVRAIRRPAIFPYREYHDQGVLMSYGPSGKDNMHRVALYVDRILKGGVPAQLPIEQSTKLDLVVDLRVARAMHIAVPDTLLALADEVLR
jgi:putative ABC transport system substrate-binding protein